MSFHNCEECSISTPHYLMYDRGLCIQCAKEIGTFQQPDNHSEVERVQAEQVRVAQENKEAFDKEKEARRELAERELCRRRLLPFVMRVEPDYMPGWLHADICSRLEKFTEDIQAGKNPRLMITVPPRHGKSALASKTFPSWYLGKFPTHEIMLCSYSGELAEDFSRKCRNLIENPDYKSLFPNTKLSPSTKSVKHWMTTDDGGCVAAGVGGPLTGRGAHVLIIDDPVKNREEAESSTVREGVKDWYSSSAYTRLAPLSGVLVIQTRWHEDDLSGWLLRNFYEAKKEAESNGEPISDDVDQWELVEYPAIAIEDEKYRKAGEALHPARFPLKALSKIKRTLIPRDWQALYQQRPVSEDGDYFTRQMFRFYRPNDMPPMHQMRIYAAADLAISTKQNADYTVFMVVGYDRNHNIWLLDLRRGRYGALGIIDQMFDIQLNWNPALFGLESGQIELTLEPFIQKAELERGISLRYEKLKTRGMDKSARARPIQGRMEQGKVYFPAIDTAPWMESLIAELLAFPLGRNDDQVDTLAWIGNMLMTFATTKGLRAAEPASFKDKYRIRTRKRSSLKKTSMSA